MAATMMLTLVPLDGAAATAAERPRGPRAASVSTLPECDVSAVPPEDPGVVSQPWETLLDAEGAVVGHRMTLHRQGTDHEITTGPRGFSADIAAGRMLLGERSDDGTQLTMLDIQGACQTWQRTLDQLVYDIEPEDGGVRIRLSTHEPVTRLFEGTLVIRGDTGATEAMIDGECSTVCEPNDGEVPPAVFTPAGPPRPVPVFAAGAWPRDKDLPFRWQASSVPPKWARKPLLKAADDTRRSSDARSPIFRHASGASDSVRYTAGFPSFCRFGIACASRSMPTVWAVWIRPHGTDFAWGTLRWCQKPSGDGCFDLRRVMLHELGHVTGLNHPESAGFRLGVDETVMQAVTPASPRGGSHRHAFGRCDVASLQELYDTPDRETRISSCNDLETRLGLWSSASSVASGDSVKLTAVLRIADRSAYGLLAGNKLDDRSVKLKFRRAGSNDGWSTAWMEPASKAGRYELTIKPQATWEFEATFPVPADEGLRFSWSDPVKVTVKS